MFNRDRNVVSGKFPEDTSSEEDSPQAKKVCRCSEWLQPIEISSDEELENSMVELEKQISLEMSDTE